MNKAIDLHAIGFYPRYHSCLPNPTRSKSWAPMGMAPQTKTNQQTRKFCQHQTISCLEKICFSGFPKGLKNVRIYFFYASVSTSDQTGLSLLDFCPDRSPCCWKALTFIPRLLTPRREQENITLLSLSICLPLAMDHWTLNLWAQKLKGQKIQMDK